MIFRRLFKYIKKSPEKPKLLDAISIDICKPDFHDFFPTKEAIYYHLDRLNIFKANHLDWITNLAYCQIKEGSGCRGATKQIVRQGALVGTTELSRIGVSKKAKVGQRFSEALNSENGRLAISQLEQALLVASSIANQLHNLRRMEEIGINTFYLRGPQDERSTAVELAYEGKKLTIFEAKALIQKHGDVIARSVFAPIINF